MLPICFPISGLAEVEGEPVGKWENRTPRAYFIIRLLSGKLTWKTQITRSRLKFQAIVKNTVYLLLTNFYNEILEK